VITTVSSAEKAAIAHELGADETIHYRNENLPERITELTDGMGADVVYDTVGPAVFQDSIPLTAHYGRLVTLINPAGTDWTEARTRNLAVHFTLMLAPWVRNLKEHWLRQIDILRQCGELFDNGKLHIRVEKTLPLEQAAEAHRIIEQGHASGKIVLTI
jgi:NADPH2:quinone reductase